MLYVGSYLELYTTVIGWSLYQQVYNTLLATGLLFLPFIIILFRNWKAASTASRGLPAGEVSIKRNAWDIGIALFVLTLAMVPMITLEPSTIGHRPAPTFTDPTPDEVTADNSRTTYDNTLGRVNSPGTVKIPFWWWLVMKVTAGLNVAIRDGLPSAPDLQAALAQLKAANISDPRTAKQFQYFLQDCHVPARNRFGEYVGEVGGLTLPPPGPSLMENLPEDEIEWVGSRVFLETPGLYARCDDPDVCQYTLTPDREVPGLASDATCGDWWAQLHAALLKEGDLELLDRMLRQSVDENADFITRAFARRDKHGRVLTRELVEDIHVRNVLNNFGRTNRSISGERTSDSYNFKTSEGVTALGKGLLGWVGTLWTSATFQTSLSVMKQGLPMVQAFMLMAVFILLPIILVISSYSLETFFTVTVILIGLKILTALWAIAGWIETHLIVALYQGTSGAASYVLDGVFGHDATKRLLLGMLTGALYLGLPVLLYVALSWAGVKGAERTGQATDGMGGQASQQAGKQAGSLAGEGMNKLRGKK